MKTENEVKINCFLVLFTDLIIFGTASLALGTYLFNLQRRWVAKTVVDLTLTLPALHD
jgi:hypothetical protein